MEKSRFITYINCLEKIKHDKIKPTQFPSGFDIKKYKHVMLDVSTEKEIKCGVFGKLTRTMDKNKKK